MGGGDLNWEETGESQQAQCPHGAGFACCVGGTELQEAAERQAELGTQNCVQAG